MSEVINKYEIEDLTGKDQILSYLTINQISHEIISFGDVECIIFDKFIIDDFEYVNVYEKSKWIYTNTSNDIRSTVEDQVNENFNAMFWRYPETLYHATKQENIESIKTHGLKATHISRGMANRHITRAVFTALDPEWITEHYGPVVFAINTIEMKKDGYMPFVSKEPNHIESDVLNIISNKIKLSSDVVDYSDARSEGTTEDTIIIYDNVPAKYLTEA